MFRVAIVSLVILALLLTGCAQAAQKAVEQATGVQVDQKGENVTIKGKDGEQLTVSSNVPDELKNFPVPPGFTAQKDGAGTLSTGGAKTSVASWKGKGKVEDTVAFYKKTLTDQGYKEEMSMTAGDGGVLSYTKGDSSVSITISKKDGDNIELAVLIGSGSNK
ncbi:MAG: hypothetical protein M1370_10070 [Bacteroidetes bacterium]|nr:hypothetical protein [Bacteroidota bacterium]MCL5024993.1 hypothetical protein [Chloroflexota bacterium]